MLDPSGPNRTPRIRGSVGRATTLVVATAALVAGAGLPTAVAAQAETLAPKRVGATPVAPAGAAKTAAPSGDTKLDLSITLQPRNPGELESFISAVSTPHSPLYRHYLGTGEFGKRFGADPATVASVRQVLKAAGLNPGEVGPNGLTIPVTATVAQAKKAFNTDFAGYKLRDGSTGFTNTQAPAVRGDVAKAIAGVVGLDTTSKLKPHSVKADATEFKATNTGRLQAHNIGSSPQLCSEWTQILANNNRYDGQQYYSSGSLATAYDLSNMPDGASGATVAIMSLENYDSQAVANYQACNGTKASVSNIRVSGTDAAPDWQHGEGGETALDVETVAGLAPGASILVYQAENTDPGMLGNYQRIVDDNRAQVISTSWGMCERYSDSATDAALNTILQQAAAQGQSVVAASGDSGSTDCYRAHGASDPAMAVDSPAALPYATGVGGTSMSGLGQFPGPVSVWNSGFGAGGGGVSTRWKQSDAVSPGGGFKAPGYTNVCGAGAGETCRQVPDVSALADGAHGYLVFTRVDGNGSTFANIYGGTSGAAPLWAAIIAHADASVACAANGPVGFLNPALYKLAGNDSVFTDVTIGNNDLAASGYTGGNFAAGNGYDLATGLGAPKGRGVINALCQSLPTKPAGTFTSLAPKRLLDTRHMGPNKDQKNPVPSRSSIALQVAGSDNSGVPANGVTAVVLNITATDTNGPGYLTAWPTGKSMPTASNLNWMDGSIAVPNLVTVPVGDGGKVSLFNGSWNGNVAMVVDIFGYYTADNTGSTFTPLAPARLFDTRYGTGTNIPKAQIGSKKQLDVQVAGSTDIHGNPTGVPASGVTAVVLNTTVTRGNSGGWLQVFPTGGATPGTSSNLNWFPGQTVPNLVIVPVSADGKVSFYNGSWDSVDVLADVFGYFSKDANGGKFHVAGPKRVVDTRPGKGADSANKIGDGQVLRVSLQDNGVLQNATSVVLNITVTRTERAGYLNAWADGTSRPGSSNLNWTDGNQTIANLVTVPVHNGVVDIESNSPTDVIVDVAGYYSNN